MLTESKNLGDILVVVVARDSTVKRRKGRIPGLSEQQRLSVVSSLRSVDVALPGSSRSFNETVNEDNPDVVALGYDQESFGVQLAQQLTERKLNQIEIQRLTIQVSNIKSSKIVQMIQDLGM